MTTVYDELKAFIADRDVRTAQRLKLLSLLEGDDSADRLRELLDQHETQMRKALERLREELA